MDRKGFNLSWAALIAAFPNSKTTPQSQDVYWMMLQDMPKDWFEKGIRKCLSECTFFPTINDLGRASVPAQVGGGRMSAHLYVEEYEIPWQRTLEQKVSGDRIQIEPKQRKQLNEKA